MNSHAPSYHRCRFPPEIISHAVWLYHRFCLSFRDTEDLLAQRGVTVTYETIRQWCQTFGPAYARTLRRRRGRMGDTWYLDELFVTIQGRRQYLWRAVDEDGDVIDILVQSRAQSTGGRQILPQAIERTGSRAAPADHRQAAQLRGGAPHRDALRGPQYPTVREQSRRGLAPTHATTRATDAPVQIRRARATISLGPRTRAESLSCRPSPTPSGSPPLAQNAFIPHLG